ncbi:integrator complex subunit 13 [Macrosteles quadrilineatus]|uniref:integrator complex subunit 13 n=1 Tax=Macrosteles quadrilineatus TaxID=74068 RepID=UPI0023E31D11|nr:integrator complex subunit 13 [Macrosteles quadrilineatus]XP_054271137.1 integrator complex subunit 13 [Macrosteles quadrilineatus]XP_054271138.1 integrator complex subunit 13 [Macrosteles quadrilineatus]
MTSLISQQMYPPSHKTIFVLDHTPYFGISSEDLLEFDFTKARGPGFIPLAPIVKSLWTCIVEAALEYCRIVWDIFPQHNKLVRFIVSDSQAHTLNSWNISQQSTTHLLNALSVVGVPPRASSADYSIVHGLQAAISAMCECSDAQHEKRTALTENATKVLNRCRVICLTSARDNASIKSMEEIFQNELVQANKLAAASDHLIPIHHCHLVIINVYPNNLDVVAVTPHPPLNVSNLLSTEVHCAKAAGQVASKLSHLILSHYDLASTTVTGIPMKEEQNASSSANYDVEIFHASHAHTTLLGNAADTAIVKTMKEGSDYETVTLKWCTPRGMSPTEVHNCTSMFRITPVDVNSRPSSCLINFLLNGRSVMLEMVRRGGGKVMSHLLAAHGGEIFIHSLGTGRSILEDPPSISEGCGGRVTDYRITDFGIFMQQNKLIPVKKKDKGSAMSPNAMVKSRLENLTKFWPITISSTCIFNFKQYTEPLLSLMVKDTLTEEEVVQCKQGIYSLIGLEAKHEPLQAPTVGQRGKGPKREEQYRQMWAELETFLRAYTQTEQHTRVLQCLLECRNKEDDKVKVEKVELDTVLRELDQFSKDSSSSRSGTPTPMEITHRASVIRATTDSPMSPPLQTTRPRHIPRSLLDMWIARNTKPKRAQFYGQLTAEPYGRGSRARLYLNMKPDPNAPGVDKMAVSS